MSPTGLPEPLRRRYQLLRRAGSGAAGTVLLAHDQKLDRDVAIKVLHERAREDEQHLIRFSREVAILVQHPHPCLVPVLDADVTHDPPYLVSHWMSGGSLHHRIRTRDQADPEEVARAGARLARALDHLHGHGVLHRDVKPLNVLLDDQGEVYLADLGLGRAAEMSSLTETGYLVGTPRYMAPELLERGTYSPSSDIYALGVSLIELSRRPKDLPDIMTTNVLQTLTAGIGHRELRQILRRAVRSEPEERWPDAAALAEALTALAQGEAATAPRGANLPSEDVTATQPLSPAAPSAPTPPPASAPRPGAPPIRRSGFAGLAVGIVASTMFLGWLSTRSSAPAPPSSPPPSPPTDVARGLPRRAIDRLLEGHRFPDGSVRPALHGGDYVQHEAQVIQDMLDPRFSIRWRRMLEGLNTWALEVDLEQDRRASLDEAVAPLLDTLHHLACDQMIARLFLFRVSTPLVTGVSRAPEGAAANLDHGQIASLQARVQEVQLLVRDALQENALLRTPPGPWAEVLGLRLRGLVADERLHEGVSRALEGANEAEDPVRKAQFLAGGLTCLPTTLHRDVLRCAQVLPFYREALAFTRAPPPGVPRRLRLELACDLVLYWFSQGSKCLPRGEEREGALRDALKIVEELLEEDPALPLQVLTFAAHQQTTAAMVGRGISSKLVGELERMERLRDTARAALR